MKLTDRTVAALSCPGNRKDLLHFDDSEPGFGVRVTRGGVRILIFQYRVGRKVRRHRIGVWGQALTVAAARRTAEKLRGEVNDRKDPVGDQKRARTAFAAAEAAAREQSVADALTFSGLINAWQERGLAHRRPRYRTDAVNRLRTYFANWQNRPAHSVSRREAIQAIDEVEIRRGTTSARRAMAYARACYGWAIKRDLLEENPFKGNAPPGRENPRDRVLSGEEIGVIWRSAGALDPIYGPFLKLLMLTLQRREELPKARWPEFAEDLSTWTVPSERAKNGRAHVVHLPELARDILRSIPRMKDVDLVFPGSLGKREITGFSTMKSKLVASIEIERTNAGVRPARLPDWRLHDFRRTGVTALANSGFAPHVCDRLLNHITGVIQGVAAVYQRAEFSEERKAALKAWAAYVDQCGSGRLTSPEVACRPPVCGRWKEQRNAR